MVLLLGTEIGLPFCAVLVDASELLSPASLVLWPEASSS